MNFLKGIKLLETNAGNFSNLLKNLSERFRDNAIKKVNIYEIFGCTNNLKSSETPSTQEL